MPSVLGLKASHLVQSSAPRLPLNSASRPKQAPHAVKAYSLLLRVIMSCILRAYFARLTLT